MSALPALSGGRETYALGNNASGAIAGASETPSGLRAVLWTRR